METKCVGKNGEAYPRDTLSHHLESVQLVGIDLQKLSCGRNHEHKRPRM